MTTEIWRPKPPKTGSWWRTLAWIAAFCVWSRVPLLDSMPALWTVVGIFILFKALSGIFPGLGKQDPPRAAQPGDFEIVLRSVGHKRINVIKVFREYDIDVPLELVRGSLAADYVVVRNVDPEYANDVVAALRKVGAQAQTSELGQVSSQ